MSSESRKYREVLGANANSASRETFELFAREFGMTLDRFKRDPDAYKYQQAADG